MKEANPFAFKARFEATEAYRTLLVNKFDRELRKIRSRKEVSQKSFFDLLEERSGMKNPDEITNIGGIPLNFAKLNTPTINTRSKTFLEEAFGKNSDNLSESARFDLRNQARDILKMDPYFLWLEKNKLTNKKATYKSGSFTTNYEKKSFDPIENSKKPIDLFLSTLEVSGPTHLTWELSLMRIMRDLDPNLTSEMRALAEDALTLHKAEVALTHGISPLGNKEARDREPSGWDWALNHNEAQKHLKALQVEIKKKYEPLFSEASHKLLSEMATNSDPILFELDAAARKSRNQPKDLEIFFSSDKLVALREKLNLSKDPSLLSQAWMIHKLYKRGYNTVRTYDEVLAIGFLESDTTHQYLELKEIVKVGEGLTSDSAFVNFVKSEIRELYFWY